MQAEHELADALQRISPTPITRKEADDGAWRLMEFVKIMARVHEREFVNGGENDG